MFSLNIANIENLMLEDCNRKEMIPSVYSMEQPLPMSPSLAPEQFSMGPGPGEAKLEMAGFNMAQVAAKVMAQDTGPFIQGMEMMGQHQDFSSGEPPGTCQCNINAHIDAMFRFGVRGHGG